MSDNKIPTWHENKDVKDLELEDLDHLIFCSLFMSDFYPRFLKTQGNIPQNNILCLFKRLCIN